MAPKNPRNIIFFLHYQINANGKNNHVFFDVSKINVDVHTCYLTEKYHHKNRDTLKYKKKGGYQFNHVDKDMDILVYICIDFHTACEHSLL